MGDRALMWIIRARTDVQENVHMGEGVVMKIETGYIMGMDGIGNILGILRDSFLTVTEGSDKHRKGKKLE